MRLHGVPNTVFVVAGRCGNMARATRVRRVESQPGAELRARCEGEGGYVEEDDEVFLDRRRRFVVVIIEKPTMSLPGPPGPLPA